jgi:hypothetical protein
MSDIRSRETLFWTALHWTRTGTGTGRGRGRDGDGGGPMCKSEMEVMRIEHSTPRTLSQSFNLCTTKLKTDEAVKY